MEKYEINKFLNEFDDKLISISKSLDISNLQKEIEKLEKVVLKDDFWSNPKEAEMIISSLNYSKELNNTYLNFVNQVNNIKELLDLLENDELNEISNEILTINKDLKVFETQILLNEKYDDSNAILELHPGQGGTEALDWADMLFRMYTLYCKAHKFKMNILNYEAGEVGIKSISVEIKGKNAYGLLKSERGVHRLVRISPFDSNKRRHTTFVSCDIAPVIKNDLDINIDDKDLRIDTYLSSGHGGQGVNTTYSAVRITYLPLNIVVTCQNERSQIQNKEEALRVLKSKLLEIEILKQELNLKEIKGEQLSNGFGSQIRSYVFTPYTMVKDHRTNFETSDVKGVMDGEIDDFINSYLSMKAGKKNGNR